MYRFFYRLAHLDLYQEPPAVRYGLALLFVAEALALNSLPPAGTKLPFIFFFGAVALSAHLCGFGPAVMATVLSGILARFFFMPPYYSLIPTAGGLAQILLFILVSLIITSAALQTSVAQIAAAESQSRLAEALKSITEGFITISPDWNITYVNPTGAQIFGLTPEQMTGRNAWDIAPRLKDTSAFESLQKAMRGQQPVHFDTYYEPLKCWYQVAAFPAQRGLTVILQDISEARQTAEALRLSERRLQFAQVAAKLGSWEWNLKTNELWWTDGIWTLHGRPVGSVQPTFENWISFIHPEDRERCQYAIEKSQAGPGDYEVEYRTIWPDGAVRWIVARGQVLFDDAQRPERMLGIGIDITERKQAEDALRKSEKLAAAGRLAATIAHEINNPLAAVTNLLYLLRQSEFWDEKSRWYVAQAERELNRVAHVARQTLGFYRDTTSPRSVNLSKTVEEVVSLYLPRIEGRKITLATDFDPRAQVMGLAGEIRQVISNLVANAIDALDEGGTLSIRVYRCRELAETGRIGARIVIADGGSGIPTEQRKKIFEPFFTTKQDVGTGLGLWVSREMVHKHGGYIRLRSSTGPRRRGTVFSVFLPAETILDSRDYRAVS
ncbi:MAG TPA: PAS domain-containing protein [Candidatus Angelobacter sp.]|jgi:PAS domain S-box-containing protein|nr:PAS domain-containing protein [Candidatus Angelobacter sp.]